MQKMYHMNVKIFSRGKGHNFRQKLAYRDGGIYEDLETGHRVNYHQKHYTDKIENDFIIPKGADKLLHNRNDYYDVLERKETAKNAQYFREFEVAFPDDISKDDKKDIACRFGKSLADEGMFVDINYHKLDSKNPHAHILTSLRGVDENGNLGNKNRDWNKKENVDIWRKRFADIVNEKYKELGIKNFVSEKSYQEQGKNQVATKKLPVNKKSKEYKDRVKLNREIRVYNSEKMQKNIKEQIRTGKKNIRIKRYTMEDFEDLKRIKKDLRRKLIQERIFTVKEKKLLSRVSLQEKLKQQKQALLTGKVKKAKDRGLSL